MIVPPATSELRSLPARARATRSRNSAKSVLDALLCHVVQRRREDPALAQRHDHADVHALAGDECAVAPEAVHLRHLEGGPGDRLQEQRHGQHALRDGPRRVLLGQPGERPRQIDAGSEVVLRDLAVRSLHGRGDHGTHAGLLGDAGRRHGGDRGRARGGSLHVVARDRALGSGTRHGRELDAEIAGEPARERRGVDARPRRSCDTLRCRHRRRGRGPRSRNRRNNRFRDRRRSGLRGRRRCRRSRLPGLAGADARDRGCRPARSRLRATSTSSSHAGAEALDLDLGLVGVDERDDLAALDPVTGLLVASRRIVPRSMSAPSDGIRKSGMRRSSARAQRRRCAAGCGSAASSRCFG